MADELVVWRHRGQTLLSNELAVFMKGFCGFAVLFLIGNVLLSLCIVSYDPLCCVVLKSFVLFFVTFVYLVFFFFFFFFFFLIGGGGCIFLIGCVCVFFFHQELCGVLVLFWWIRFWWDFVFAFLLLILTFFSDSDRLLNCFSMTVKYNSVQTIWKKCEVKYCRIVDHA